MAKDKPVDGLSPYTKVYVVGSTDLLGFSGKEPTVKLPKLCSYNILIKQVACGPRHTHMLTQDGYLYSMGFNENGVLGLGKSEQELRHTSSP